MTTIRQTHFYGGGAVWRADNLNDGATTPLEDLAGRNGKRDREASLEVLSGPDGNRYVRIPQGTTGQRPRQSGRRATCGSTRRWTSQSSIPARCGGR